MKDYYVYILASKQHGVLYTGITSDILKRIWEHKSNAVPGFTSKYRVYKLVYFEIHADVMEAIKREKNIKSWKRQWKIRLVEEENSGWNDLYEDII
jgi:putative endonuclease